MNVMDAIDYHVDPPIVLTAEDVFADMVEMTRDYHAPRIGTVWGTDTKNHVASWLVHEVARFAETGAYLHHSQLQLNLLQFMETEGCLKLRYVGGEGWHAPRGWQITSTTEKFDDLITWAALHLED